MSISSTCNHESSYCNIQYCSPTVLMRLQIQDNPFSYKDYRPYDLTVIHTYGFVWERLPLVRTHYFAVISTTKSCNDTNRLHYPRASRLLYILILIPGSVRCCFGTGGVVKTLAFPFIEVKIFGFDIIRKKGWWLKDIIWNSDYFVLLGILRQIS